jgi:hypothetical protein
MLPTPKSAHKDAALTNISIGYRNSNYIADRVFPMVPVAKMSDYYFKFLKGAWFRNEARVRQAGSAAVRGGYPLTSAQYVCSEYAFAHPVPLDLLNNADSVLRPLETGVQFALDKVMLAKEKIVSDLVTNTSNWTTTNDAEGGWAASTNTFITDVETGKEAIRKLIGRYPNVMVMDAKTFKAVKQCDDVVDRIKYTGTAGNPAAVTTKTIAQLFELDEVLVGTALYSSAEEIGAGTDFTAVDMWETTATKGSAFLCYRPQMPALDVPSAGYIFNWTGVLDGLPTEIIQREQIIPRAVRRWWEEAPKSWIVEAFESFNAKVTSADSGYLFYDTILT